MKSALSAFVIVATLLFITGCGPQRIAQTRSGRPEVIINSSSAELVRDSIVNEMQLLNFYLQDDSKYRLVFTKQMEGMSAAFAQLAIGNSYSTTPVAEVNFNLVKVDDRIRVMAFSSMSTQMAFGQVNRADMKNNNAWFNDLYRLLQKVKYNVESNTHSEKIVASSLSSKTEQSSTSDKAKQAVSATNCGICGKLLQKEDGFNIVAGKRLCQECFEKTKE